MAKQKAIKKFALTDINNTSACMDFVRLSKKYEVQPVLGVDFRNGAQQQFIMLAKNNEGFQHINSYLSSFLHHNDLLIPEKAMKLPHTYVVYPFNRYRHHALEEHEYLGVNYQDINQLKFSKWNTRQEKLVALHTVSFKDKKDYNIHRLLRAIDNNLLLSKLPEEEQGHVEDCMLTEGELEILFKDYLHLINNTKELLERCSIHFDFSSDEPNNQKTYTGNEELDFRLLEKLCRDAISYRYKKHLSFINSRLTNELNVIRQKGFVSYFLINWKILKYARSKGYFYVGRGSGANSIIAYLLRITDVDPIDLDLYFERFINLYRKNPPDFDIDFSWTDRDDVIRFIFNKFPHTALLTVYNTFKYKAAIRELGKVFGLPNHEIDLLGSEKHRHKDLDRLSQLILVYAQAIQGFPNYLGIHAGGIIISERSVHYYTATFMPPKGFPTTQFDMIAAEDIGLYKFDILSQRGLGKIKDTVEIIHKNHPQLPTIDIHDIERFKQDEKIKELLRNAKAIGCFYVESPAMRMLLKKLQVDNYLGLVAASSIIRPGVAKSGMMREYILRYRNPERRQEAHPVMLNIMPETYGVMVYQEDVIKVAHYFAGLTLGEADMLRRGMSGKFRSREEFLKVKSKYFTNCNAKGYKQELAQEIWKQIESFAGYAFAKGHSASYAVESYQSLFLKAYFPLEYMVATINNFGGFYRTELYVHEARMHGAIITAPCVNKSNYETNIERNTIFLGFILLRSLEEKIAKKVVAERLLNGEYENLDDFIDRVPVSMEQISILIKINAFRFTGINKRALLWQAHMKIQKIIFDETVISLFKTEKIAHKLPALPYSSLEDAFDEIELIGFSLCNPFDLLLHPVKNKLLVANLPNFIGKEVTIMGYLVTVKNTKTSNGDLMHFGNFLDYEGYFIDTVHFPPVVAKNPFRGRGIYSITGKVVEEFDCITIEVSSMKHLPLIEDPRYAEPQKNVS